MRSPSFRTSYMFKKKNSRKSRKKMLKFVLIGKKVAEFSERNHSDNDNCNWLFFLAAASSSPLTDLFLFCGRGPFPRAELLREEGSNKLAKGTLRDCKSSR